MEWHPIETYKPEMGQVLVSCTYNLSGGGNDNHTDYWVDFKTYNDEWAVFPRLVHVPIYPDRWTPIIDKDRGQS